MPPHIPACRTASPYPRAAQPHTGSQAAFPCTSPYDIAPLQWLWRPGWTCPPRRAWWSQSDHSGWRHLHHKHRSKMVWKFIQYFQVQIHPHLKPHVKVIITQLPCGNVEQLPVRVQIVPDCLSFPYLLWIISKSQLTPIFYLLQSIAASLRSAQHQKGVTFWPKVQICQVTATQFYFDHSLFFKGHCVASIGYSTDWLTDITICIVEFLINIFVS